MSVCYTQKRTSHSWKRPPFSWTLNDCDGQKLGGKRARNEETW